MGIYKRHDVWWIDFVYKGKRVRRSTETSDKKLAKRILDKVKGEIAEGKWFERLPGETKTLKEVIDKYLKRSIGKVPGSRYNDRCISNTLLRFFDPDAPIIQITPSLIGDYEQKRIEQGISPGSINNILSLRWPEIDLLRKTVTIWEQKNKETDTLPLNETAVEVLKGRVRHIRSPLVFYGPEGKKIQKGKLLSALHDACRKAGIEHMHFHDLRHTWATWLHQDGGDLLSIQKLGRWKDIRMVQRYAHHNPESLRTTAKILDRRRLSQISHSEQAEHESTG